MNRNQLMMANLKEEGLVIVDEDGFEFESEEQNIEQYEEALDPANDDYSMCKTGEEVWDRHAMYEHERKALRLHDKKKRFIHRSRGVFCKWDDGMTAYGGGFDSDYQ